MSIPRRLRALWSDRPGFVALSLLTLAALLVWPILDVAWKTMEFGTQFRYYDFGVYSGTVDSWLSGGEVYQLNEDGNYHGSYLYPPVTLLFFVPFSVFPFSVGATLLGAFSLVLLWAGLEAVVETFGYRLRLEERLVLLAALFGFHPLLFTFKMAQVPTVLTAILCFAYAATEGEADRPPSGYVGGVLTTLGASMKLFYATAGAHLLRDRRRFAGAMAAVIGLFAFSLAVFGVDTHLAYLDVLAWGKGWGTDPRPPELWMPAYFRPLYPLDGMALPVVGSLAVLSLPIRVLGVLAVIALALAARHADDPTTRRATFALGVAVAPLLAPKAYTQDLVLLLLPAVVLLGIELNRPDGRPWIPVLAVGLLHVHSFGLRAVVDPPAWLSPADLVGDLATMVQPEAFGTAFPAAVRVLDVDLVGWLQPGLWGALLLVGLAGSHVAAAARWPSGLPDPPSVGG